MHTHSEVKKNIVLVTIVMGQGAGILKPTYGANSELVAIATYFGTYGQRYARPQLKFSLHPHWLALSMAGGSRLLQLECVLSESSDTRL